MTSRKLKNRFGSRCEGSLVPRPRGYEATVRGDSGVAGEGRVVGIPKFYSWGKCNKNDVITHSWYDINNPCLH